MRRIGRTRRPLVALVALVALLAVGYAVRGVDGGSDGPASSTTAPASEAPTSGAPTSGAPTSGAPTSGAPTSGAPTSAGGAVALSALPVQAAQTYRLIRSGGPFPYPRNDGVVFHNFEHVLPAERDGYYHEYTVPTPGSDDRGARRLVTGADGRLYYTGDHYETFEPVDVSR